MRQHLKGRGRYLAIGKGFRQGSSAKADLFAWQQIEMDKPEHRQCVRASFLTLTSLLYKKPSEQA